MPLHCVPTTTGKQPPVEVQQTPLGPQVIAGVHGPVTEIHPVGHGAMFWQMPVAGSQQAVCTQGFGWHEERFGKIVPVHCVVFAINPQLPAASQQTICGQGLGLQEVWFGKIVPLQVAPMASGKQLFCRSQQTPCEGGHGLTGTQGPVTAVHPAGQGVTVWQTPDRGSQQTVGVQGFGLHEVVFVRIWPLHAVPSTHGMQLPSTSQHTPLNCGTGQSVAVQGPMADVHPAGQGVSTWQLPVCGSQQTFCGHGFGVHEPTRNEP